MTAGPGDELVEVLDEEGRGPGASNGGRAGYGGWGGAGAGRAGGGAGLAPGGAGPAPAAPLRLPAGLQLEGRAVRPPADADQGRLPLALGRDGRGGAGR